MATIDRLQDMAAHEAGPAPQGGARWAWIACCALLAGAAVLVVAPRALPDTAPTVADLARSGLTWPLLAGFGLVLAAIATSARRPIATEPASSTPEAARESATPLASDPLARDIAAELARVRGGLHDLRIEFVYVKDALARVQQNGSLGESDANRDVEAAIFRLAASLDQLGGRMEHELSTQRTWLAEVVENQARRTVVGTEPLPSFADPYLQGLEGPEHEIDLPEGFAAGEDDVHVEVSLDEDENWFADLGVLDEIEEPRGPLAHGKTSPSHRPASADALLGELAQAGSARAELDEKMAQLRDLLSDPAVVRALESQSR